MQFVINGVKYWIMLGPSGLTLYRREGTKTKYLGRRPLEEVRRLLAQASVEALQKIISDIEAVRQVLEERRPALESQKPPQTAQAPSPSLTWKKDDHIYWLVQYGRTFYIYMKGPSTRHKPRLIEKTDVSGAIDRLAAAGALHVLEALRLLINGLYSAVVELLRPRSAAEASHGEAREESKKPQAERDEAQRARRVSRREAEAALRELKSALRRAAERWGEEWMKTRGLEEPDAEWFKEKLTDFVDAHIHLVEKILLHQDLLDKFADAAVEAAAGRLTRRDVLEILNQL